MTTVLGRRLLVTDHAQERYHERVKPALDARRASADLERVLQLGEMLTVIPEWARSDGANASAWLTVGDSLAFPIVESRIVTCLTRGGYGSKVRRERSAWKRRVAAPKRKKPHGRPLRSARRQRWDLRGEEA